MSNENPNVHADDVNQDFADVHTGQEASATGKTREEFQEEFKAVFENDGADNGSNTKKKRKFQIASPDGFSTGLFDWIKCVIFAIVIVVFCLTFCFRLVEVDGTSMMDTLTHHDKVIVTDMFYTPHNNDIIVISHGSNYNQPIIKRVIAVAGQAIKLDYDNNKIYVDGIELKEDYIKDGETFGQAEGDNPIPAVVPEGKIFVMGDHRHVSLDSRSSKIGLIDVKDVIGKAQLVVFPFNHFGYVYDK